MKIVVMSYSLRRATRAALLWVGTAALTVTSLSGCSTDDTSDGQLHVVTAFYPLQYAAERVAGDHADVTNLTRPGAEPHDVDLSPKDVARLNDADLVVYLRGYQPALDASITQVTESEVVDVGAIPGVLDRGGGATDDEHADHARDTAGTDPHFWLDPLRLAKVGDELAERLGRLDPEHAAAYRRHARELRDDLETLDDDYETGLASCASRVLVTSHESFGYLARRYDFEQIGVEGLVPDQEPSPAQISKVARFVREHGVSTIYHETLVSPRIAETLAAETGARVAVLDPLEGLTQDSPGDDYLTVMRANLQTLRKGQSCR
jgi:zinc transport system substrate-binding protein